MRSRVEKLAVVDLWLHQDVGCLQIPMAHLVVVQIFQTWNTMLIFDWTIIYNYYSPSSIWYPTVPVSASESSRTSNMACRDPTQRHIE